MKDEHVSAVNINECVRDHELEEIEALRNAAKPGEWYARNGRVERFDKTPVDDEASIRFMARSWSAVGRLVRGIRALEAALTSAWAANVNYKTTIRRMHDEHEAEIARARSGKRGPDGGLTTLAYSLKIGAVREYHAREFLDRWSRGEDDCDDLWKNYRRQSDELNEYIADMRKRGFTIEAHIAYTLLFSGETDARKLLRKAFQHLLTDEGGTGKPLSAG